MIDDKDFQRLIDNEKMRSMVEQVGYTIAAYYRLLCTSGIPSDAALALTLHFQERLLNPPRGGCSEGEE